MNTPIYNFFTEDHRRVEDLLERATRDIEHIDLTLYNEFRKSLLTHIKMEEKILFPAAQMANNGQQLPLQAQLRLEHGAITTLMVPTPDKDLVKVIKYILEKHDELEEQEGGMYEVCEKLTQEQTEEIIAKLQETTIVPVHPHNDAEYAMQAAKRCLQRAGYDYEEIVAM